MKVTTFEGVIENGQVRLPVNIHLPEKAKVYVVIPEVEVQPAAYMGSPRMADQGHRNLAHVLLRALAVVWASPYTLIGLAIGVVGLCTGGRARVRGGAIEFFGGGVQWFVRHLPLGETTLAFTLGHTILGQTAAGLDLSCKHERIHVRQFERWGPLMGPAYLGCSLVLWLMRRRPYRDNPFEREAFNLGGDG